MSNELEKKEDNVDDKAMQAIMDSFGTSKPDIADYLLNTSIKGILPPSKQSDKNIKAVFSLIKEMDAQNPIEAMLYSQMIACHTQAMNLFKLGNDAYDHNVAQKFLGMADRFMRTYNKSLETLERFKRGGRQHVIVENVVVNSGGQAIVGSVNPNRGGQIVMVTSETNNPKKKRGGQPGNQNAKKKRGAQPGNKNAKKKHSPEQVALNLYLEQMNQVLDKFNTLIKEVG